MSFKHNMVTSYKQSGAALLAVLIVAVVMAILLGVVSATLQSRLVIAQQSKDKLQDQADVYAKLNELVYLTATARDTVAGLSQGKVVQLQNEEGNGNFDISPIGDELRVDGYLYKQEDGLGFSIQNQNGLIPINSSGQYWLKRWLTGYGLSSIEQARYSDVLADYADPDTWRRPSGAELSSYKGLPFSEPANFLLQSCTELWRLVVWPTLLQTHPAMFEECSLGRGDSLNLNAIPEGLWKILWPNSAQKLSARRKQGKWFVNDNDIRAVEPTIMLMSDEYYSPLGGKLFNLKVHKGSETLIWDVERGVGNIPPLTIRKSASKK